MERRNRWRDALVEREELSESRNHCWKAGDDDGLVFGDEDGRINRFIRFKGVGLVAT